MPRSEWQASRGMGGRYPWNTQIPMLTHNFMLIPRLVMLVLIVTIVAQCAASESPISTAVSIEAYLRQHNDQFGRVYPLGCKSAGPSGYNNDSSDLREVDPKRRSRCRQESRGFGQITTEIRPQNAVQMLSETPKIVSKCCPNLANLCPNMPNEKAVFDL